MRTLLQASVWTLAVLLTTSAAAPAVEKAEIEKAVQRGVAALRQGQGTDGLWQNHQPVGMTALAALTLLECKVPADDKAILSAAEAVRKGSVEEKQTYSLALAILFLDRLGDPVDVALLESLTARLLGGQSRGGWSYECPGPSEAEKKRLEKALKNELVGRRELPKPGEDKRTVKDLSPEVQQQLQEMARKGVPDNLGDNSNTQFATLALWVARRHGLPVGPAMARIETRFRATQRAEGGWNYGSNPGEESTATMTAAGVLCLAVADAAANDLNPNKERPARDITKDKNLKGGLAVVGALIGHPAAKRKNQEQPGELPQIGGNSYYFLWTLERIAVALDLETIGNKDWYQWGAEVLLANQQPDGHWTGNHAVADTCFALMFLQRANLAKDLTANLKGKVVDPGETTLKSGGVGGDGLKKPVMKALDEKKNSKTNPNPTPVKIDDRTERGKMAKEVVQASGAKQEKLIETYRDSKGVTYTEALATAIIHLNGEAKEKARDALAERLARMKVETLTDYLKDEEAEIRRAAALACALKESKAHIPQLIEMLREKDPVVERGVVAALKDLTRQNFGPPVNATAAERDKAIAAWQEWWKKQK